MAFVSSLKNFGLSDALYISLTSPPPQKPLPVPFKIKNLNKEYKELSERVLAFHNRLKGVDGVRITKDLWKLLENVRNPPQKEAINAVYEYTFNKAKELRGIED